MNDHERKGGNSMTTQPRRKFKDDRLTNPGATSDEIQTDMALGPLDSATRAMDAKWGVNRLPELVSIATAQKFGSAIAKLNDAVARADPADTAARAAVCIRGMAAMDAEATAARAPLAYTDAWTVEAECGTLCIIRDAMMWPAAQAANPGAIIVTLREVANALDHYSKAIPMVAAVKDSFPGAQITKFRKLTELEESLDDFIKF